MTKDLVDEITVANVSLFRTTEKLLEAADEVRRDRDRLVELLEQATPAANPRQAKRREGQTR